ncbi:MAG: prolipoprotein diacylglyceryl transferase [Rhodospirillales bacterium]
MTFVIPYPSIDPILYQLGPLVIRWYALAYIGGLLLGWWYMRALAAQAPVAAERDDVDDFLVWATLGVVLGGRLGYVFFYKPGFYLDNPALIFAIWRGGMSFHGGLLGVIAAAALFARWRGIRFLPFADLIACIAPIGLFLGRLANFINGELFGRVSDVPWAMIFPRGGPYPRHPSQLYEAGMEGAVLFAVLFFLRRREAVRRRAGLLTGVFLAGYGIARTIAELFRQPDFHIGFLSGGTTMGQWLSAPMFAVGVYLMVRARRET